jgi:hypothetical protein
VFADLLDDLRGPDAAGLTHDRLEELVGTGGRVVLRQLFQDHLDLRAVREERDLTARLAQGERPAGRAAQSRDTSPGRAGSGPFLLRHHSGADQPPVRAGDRQTAGRGVGPGRHTIDTYWPFHLAREHQRVHHNSYQLTA